MYVNGVCYKFEDGSLTPTSQNITPGYQECTSKGIDIVFLIDGSGSIRNTDFITMKNFMVTIINNFKNKNTNFAVVQFSQLVKLEFDFNQYLSAANQEMSIKSIRQLGGGTPTPSGIKYVADNVFVASAGTRSDATRILLTITDGESNDKTTSFREAILAANKKNIIRYAIGVGRAFDKDAAHAELKTIASSNDLVFKVGNFDALNGIQNQLEEKIFAIEGTQKDLSVSSFQQEMSQGGFSTLFNSDGRAVFGAVGAFDWSGGFFSEGGADLQFFNMSIKNRDMKDSYMGYTMELYVVSRSLGLYIVGAPRYQHRGRIVVFVERASNHKQIIEGTQVGSYFGSVLCSVDFNKDDASDVLLVGAPMYHSPNRGGLVLMYTFDTAKKQFVLAGQLKGINGQPYSRFGASISEVADLNGDKFMDLAVGAPLENNNQGSVYIFNGGTSLPITFSQRIEAAQISSGLQYFGHSLHGVMDMSGDSLPDLVVGSLGSVLVLRSRPVVLVETKITYTPDIIKMDNIDCSISRQIKLTVCFTMKKTTSDQLGIGSALITYNLVLDSVRTQFRAYFKSKERNLTETINTNSNFKCRNHTMTIPVRE
ncbi:ITAX protein, partial [Polyodon spathula]|nr:ITAX protein [Polyodon spathula]